ncbi:hypothetical protein GCM10023328_12090 [Modestobacter marinus]|uniref:Uncharacterized protein n=1 Tax=Modestobacter marinus TaxID=477641 RepID=A0ABQ2G5Y7_9ACTN|nr:hypothetical protein GCM10011589_36440 [Modestobacter marinus]
MRGGLGDPHGVLALQQEEELQGLVDRLDTVGRHTGGLRHARTLAGRSPAAAPGSPVGRSVVAGGEPDHHRVGRVAYQPFGK